MYKYACVLFSYLEDCVSTLTQPAEYIAQHQCRANDTAIPWARGHPELNCSEREFCSKTVKSPKVVSNQCNLKFIFTILLSLLFIIRLKLKSIYNGFT